MWQCLECETEIAQDEIDELLAMWQDDGIEPECDNCGSTDLDIV